jgi:glucosylceramidase
MRAKRWSRRAVMQAGARAGMGAAAMSVVGKFAGAQQMPAPEPLEDAGIRLVTTTAESAWQTGMVFKPAFGWDLLNLNVGAATGRPMQGFGGCFNELGWTSLSALSAEDRESVMHELFDPAAGARFTYCRMPIGANDYATEAYSYDETPADFELTHFSIEHDKATLVPFIQAALKQQPGLKLWASPWTPPSWMKRNNFYAEAKARPGWKDNGIREDQMGHEGEDMFRLEPKYLETYARYFAKFVEAYRAEGIHVGMVMPQNEFNSAQNFPSCTWTPEGLAAFLKHLGPEMKAIDVEVFFGTLERGNVKLLESVMNDKDAGKWVKGVGVQSGAAGVSVGAGVRRWVEQLELYQLLLAADEGLFSQRGVRVYVLEYFDGDGWAEHVGMESELAGERGYCGEDVQVQPRLLSAEALDAFCGGGGAAGGGIGYVRRCAGV